MKLLALKAAIFGVVLAVALVFVMSVSGPFEDAEDAYDSGDYATALRLWQALAEQGNATAQFNLGHLYRKGYDGVPQDHAEAVKWYRLAAEQGTAEAQTALGSMFATGRGVSLDYVRAHMWLSIAASRLPPGEGHDLAVGGRDAVAAEMTPAQLAEAQKLARDWGPK